MQLIEATPLRNRAGRKRKSTHRRKPSGDVILARVDYRSLALAWPHRRYLPEAVRLHELGETPFGGLSLVGAITKEQHEAGEIYQRAVRRYLASIQPPALAPSIAGVHQPSGGGYIDEELALRYREDYDAAFASMHEAGHKAQLAVSRVAVNGHQLRSGELPHLKRGLDALVAHYGLTAGRKYASGK